MFLYPRRNSPKIFTELKRCCYTGFQADDLGSQLHGSEMSLLQFKEKRGVVVSQNELEIAPLLLQRFC